MSRSFALERIRINVEIFCESIGDFLGSSFGSLRKPLTMLAGMALVMTLRSARKGVQNMKRGGLTAGAHDATYKANSYGYGKTTPTGYGSSKPGGLKGTAPGYGSYTPGSSASTGYGRSTTTTTGYTPGGGASSSYATPGGASAYNAASASTGGYGATGGATGYGATNTGYGATSGGYGAAAASTTYGSSAGTRALADLIDRHGAALRIMDAHAFNDYGGVHEFHGQVETLQAYEGAGVVEKVLQSPGMNKVLVVDGGGNMNVAVYSKTAAADAKRNGWKGVIIHGAIRDAKSIGETAIGCKAMATNPNRGRATTGSKGSAMNIAGMQITTGMWVYADKDGIGFSDTELTAGPGAPGQAAGGYSQTGTTATGTGYSAQASPGGYGGGGAQVGGYGSQPGGYGAQSGSASTGYGATGGYGAAASTGYGSQAGYGSGASSGYGATPGGATPGGATPGTNGYGANSNSAGGSYPYSHAGARSGDCDIRVSTAVFLSMLSLVLVPLELI